jgi:hypothetical protein
MGEKYYRDKASRSRSRSHDRRKTNKRKEPKQNGSEQKEKEKEKELEEEEYKYKYVPDSYEEFRAVCLNFICSSVFVYPMHGQDIIKGIKYEFKDDSLKEIYKPKVKEYNKYMHRIINELYSMYLYSLS